MKDYVIHWLRADGSPYSTSVVTKRSHPAAIRYAANVLKKTVAHPNDPMIVNPIGAFGFYVTESA